MSIGTVSTNILFNLPEELSLQVLSYLDAPDLARFCIVSRDANRLASDDRLWQSLFPSIEGLKKEDINDCQVGSKEDLLRRVKEFANKIQFSHQTGIFTCHFPFDSRL